MRIIRYIALCLLLSLTFSLQAYGQATTGRSFWLSFTPVGGSSTPTLTLHIAAERQCTGVVSCPMQNWQMPFSVTPGIDNIVTVPAAYAYTTRTGEVRRTAVNITTTDTVALYAMSQTDSLTTMFRVLPEEALGPDYVIHNPAHGIGTLLVVATQSGRTNISITPSCAVQGYGANWRFTVSLNQGQSYMLQSLSTADDLTGTTVETQDCAPVAVFMGCSRYGETNPRGDFFALQAEPKQLWGSRFALFSFSGNDADTACVVASQSCVLSLDDDSVAALAAGGSFKLPFYVGHILTSTAPVQVLQLVPHNGQRPVTVLGVEPLSRMGRQTLFVEPPHTRIGNQSIDIVAETRTCQSVTLDGAPVNATFRPFTADSLYSLARTHIPTPAAQGATHRIASDGGVAVVSFCRGVHDASVFPASFQQPAQQVQMLFNGMPLAPSGRADVCLNDTFTLQLLNVTDAAQMRFLAGNGTTCTFSTAADLSHSYASPGRHRAAVVIEYQPVHCRATRIDTLPVDIYVHAPSQSLTAETSCEGSYLWLGQRYTESGLYTRQLHTAYGCDSLLSLQLTMGQTSRTVVTDTVPENRLPYLFDVHAINLHGSDTVCTFIYATALGCDSTVELHLHLLHSHMQMLDTVVCQSDMPIVWRGVSFDSAGTRRLLFEGGSANGADSIVVLTLRVAPVQQQVLVDTVCQGDTLYVGTHPYTTSGVHQTTLATTFGCDSVVHLFLTVAPVYDITVHDTAVENQLPRVWNGTSYNGPASDTVVLVTALGCDSILRYHLHVWYNAADTVTAASCDSFLWYGTLYTRSGFYSHRVPHAAQGGADSLHCLMLTVHASEHGAESVVACGPYSWHGLTCTTTGDYRHRRITPEGCTVVDTLHLRIASPSHRDSTIVACGEWEWHTMRFRHSADTTLPLGLNADGCDSSLTLHVTILPNAVAYRSDTVDESALPWRYGGAVFMLPVADTVLHFVAANGCDSSLHYTLVVHYNGHSILDSIVCDNQLPILWNGVLFEGEGTRSVTLTGMAASGADSIVTMRLHVHPTYSSEFRDTVCQGVNYTWHGTSYTRSTRATATFHTVHGCDSVVTLILQVNPTSMQRLTDTIDESALPWHFGGVTFHQPVADTMLRFTTHLGCDSVIIYSLRVHYNAQCELDTTVCDDALPLRWHGHLFEHASVFIDTIPGAASTGGDSIVVYTLHVRPTYFLRYADTLCDDQPYIFNGGTYTVSGHYRWYTRSVDGCDSITDLRLTFYPTAHLTVVDTVVENQLPRCFAGTCFRTPVADTLINLLTVHGCDSLINYSLWVWPDAVQRIDSAVCDTQLPLLWDGELFTGSRTLYRRRTGVAQGGADSVLVLSLTVHPSYRNNIYDTVCQGTVYQWNDTLYTSSTRATATLATTHGCDSIVTLFLTVAPTYAVTILDTTIENQLPRVWNGTSYTGTASDTVVLATHLGCDSVIYYHLHVWYNVYDTADSVLCGDKLPILWNGILFDSADFDWSGTMQSIRTVNLQGQASHGQDSILTMRLSARKAYDLHFYDTVCQGRYTLFDGALYTDPGTYPFFYTTVYGCDSLRTLHLHANPSYYGLFDTVSICQGETFRAEGYLLWQTTDQLLRLHTTHGCDSVVQLHLDVWPVYSDHYSDTICDHDSLLFAGRVFRDSGFHAVTLPTIHGCDSLLTLSLAWYPHVTARPTIQPNAVTYESNHLRLLDESTGTVARLWHLPSYTDTARFLRYDYPLSRDSVTITLDVWNRYGCSDTAVRVIRLRRVDLWAPSAFMPSDPANSHFGLYADSLATMQLDIYSRTGLLVASFNEVGAQWDGTSHGQPCPHGTYVYLARYTFYHSPNSIHTKKGTVLLIR
ncbi:MAG: gliding motility-associated C-terminal domain-containing protein [Bacteroidales bacterium]|nr:gliding motility-associated C-terminal domain-containing protein [Bacteroidales bacterium]